MADSTHRQCGLIRSVSFIARLEEREALMASDSCTNPNVPIGQLSDTSPTSRRLLNHSSSPHHGPAQDPPPRRHRPRRHRHPRAPTLHPVHHRNRLRAHTVSDPHPPSLSPPTNPPPSRHPLGHHLPPRRRRPKARRHYLPPRSCPTRLPPLGQPLLHRNKAACLRRRLPRHHRRDDGVRSETHLCHGYRLHLGSER